MEPKRDRRKPRLLLSIMSAAAVASVTGALVFHSELVSVCAVIAVVAAIVLVRVRENQ
jgi:hypothetical protein